MKKVLIATDFSENAKNAAIFGYKLAVQTKSDVEICTAMIIPAEIPQASVIVWPMEEYHVIEEGALNELKQLKKILEAKHADGDFKPNVSFKAEPGTATDVIKTLAAQDHVELIIAGTHGAGGLSGLMLGNHARNMIDATPAPLLLIPSGFKFSPVKTIAVALDMKHKGDDFATITALQPLATLMDATMQLVHVCHGGENTDEAEIYLAEMVQEVKQIAGYAKTSSLIIKQAPTETGLNWLCNFGNVDMLAMVHHHRGLLASLFTGSHTKKMAGHIALPLLVIPAKS
jgi:nucleotide-binding universal stress UspA family protein